MDAESTTKSHHQITLGSLDSAVTLRPMAVTNERVKGTYHDGMLINDKMPLDDETSTTDK